MNVYRQHCSKSEKNEKVAAAAVGFILDQGKHGDNKNLYIVLSEADDKLRCQLVVSPQNRSLPQNAREPA